MKELQFPDWYDFETEVCHDVCDVEDKELDSDLDAKSFAGLIKNTPGCTTKACNALSQQLIHQMNIMFPDVLVSYDNLNVNLKGAAFPYLQAPAKAALARAIQERGRTMTINSGYRTIAQQLLLFNWGRSCGYNVVARPGRSNHQSGLAIDIDDYAGWRPFLQRQKWRWYGANDAVHFDYVGAGAVDIRPQTMKAFQQLWNNNNPVATITVDGIWGTNTERSLNNSPAYGFAKAPWDEQPRLLKLTTPMLEGSDIFKLQQTLKDKGFAITPDGYYGNDTKEVVEQFQAQANIEIDGVIGNDTRTALFA